MHSHQNTAGLQQPYNPRTTRAVLEAGNHLKCTHLNLVITQLANHYYMYHPSGGSREKHHRRKNSWKAKQPPPPFL